MGPKDGEVCTGLTVGVQRSTSAEKLFGAAPHCQRSDRQPLYPFHKARSLRGRPTVDCSHHSRKLRQPSSSSIDAAFSRAAACANFDAIVVDGVVQWLSCARLDAGQPALRIMTIMRMLCALRVGARVLRRRALQPHHDPWRLLLHAFCHLYCEAQPRLAKSNLDPVLLEDFGFFNLIGETFFACGGHEGVRSLGLDCPCCLLANGARRLLLLSGTTILATAAEATTAIATACIATSIASAALTATITGPPSPPPSPSPTPSRSPPPPPPPSPPPSSPRPHCHHLHLHSRLPSSAQFSLSSDGV